MAVDLDAACFQLGLDSDKRNKASRESGKSFTRVMGM